MPAPIVGYFFRMGDFKLFTNYFQVFVYLFDVGFNPMPYRVFRKATVKDREDIPIRVRVIKDFFKFALNLHCKKLSCFFLPVIEPIQVNAFAPFKPRQVNKIYSLSQVSKIKRSSCYATSERLWQYP